MSSPGMPAARYPLFQPGGRAGFTPAHAVFQADPVPLRAGNGRADDGWHRKSLRVPSALGGWRKKRIARRTKPCSRRGGSGRHQRPPLHEGKGLRHAGGRWCVGRPAIASGRLVAGAAVNEGCQRLEQVLLPSARGECTPLDAMTAFETPSSICARRVHGRRQEKGGCAPPSLCARGVRENSANAIIAKTSSIRARGVLHRSARRGQSTAGAAHSWMARVNAASRSRSTSSSRGGEKSATRVTIP